MKSFLIIDGYNIINSWSALQDRAQYSMEEAREKLIEMLANYKAYKGVEVIIVFDGHLVKGNSGTKRTINEIKVVFTKEHQTADSYIEKRVYQLSRLHFVQVATSDWAEQQTVLSSGGTRISARELEKEVMFAQSRMRKRYLNQKHGFNNITHGLDPHILKKLEQWRRRKD
ncbi:NYN domain-containing protein [Irregularibacter muris]|uniref:NYN domain-containing protein n=1 Tax=Irregularibacter muris TaxID=1796619 RepID=A0AAE3HDV2_9FIRM|nr:NYN domain-containing protein [Irregularibacter muris]MCR1898686.1 NYN domain-containing protein [Irregularibacter muris]